MNRDKAIEVLSDMGNDIRDYCEGSKHTSKSDAEKMEALEMAIAALGNDTNVPTNDGKTLVVKIPKEYLDTTARVILDSDPWCKTFYEDVPDMNVVKWIPVTPDTMPEENRVVVVCGEKGTWDYGTYRGHLNSINNWNWKKNTVKTVYWWMYKEDALPMPWEGEQNGQTD